VLDSWWAVLLVGVAGGFVPQVIRAAGAFRAERPPSRNEWVASCILATLGAGALLSGTHDRQAWDVFLQGALFPALASMLLQAITEKPDHESTLRSRLRAELHEMGDQRTQLIRDAELKEQLVEYLRDSMAAVLDLAAQLHERSLRSPSPPVTSPEPELRMLTEKLLRRQRLVVEQLEQMERALRLPRPWPSITGDFSLRMLTEELALPELRMLTEGLLRQQLLVVTLLRRPSIHFQRLAEERFRHLAGLASEPDLLRRPRSVVNFLAGRL
jgi:hypothetical protein